MENCFNEMLEYGEAVKSSFVKGHVSDWPEEVDDVEPEADPEETPETEE